MRPRSPPRALAPLLVWLASALLSGAPVLAQQNEGLFELRLTAVPDSRTTTVRLDARGQPLIPLRQALEYLEIPLTERGDTLVLEWPPGVWSTRISLVDRQVAAGRESYTLPEAQWLRSEREVYLSPEALGRVLGAEVKVDWENVSILLGGRDDFPRVRRARNEARRSADLRSGGGLRPPPGPTVPYPARSGGATGAWGISGAFDDGGFQGRARAGLGLAVAGGGLELGAGVSAGSAGARAGDPRALYSRAFPNGKWLRQLQLGSVAGESLIARQLWGFAASNEPVYLPPAFGDVLIRPVVPAGWEYEVYQGDYLVGVSTRGSTEPVSLPLSYGTTPVRIRLIGPAGQERIQQLTYLVPASQIPAGEWRWHAGAGACQSTDCALFGYGDVRRGLSPRFTGGLGIDFATRRDSASELRPYGILAFSPRPELRTELRARLGGFAYGLVQRYLPAGGWRIAGGWQRQEGLRMLPTPEWFAEAGGSLRIGPATSGQTISAQTRYRGSAGGGIRGWQTSVATGFHRIQATAMYETGFQTSDVFSLLTHVFLDPRVVPKVRDVNLNSRIDLANGGLDAASLGATFRPTDRNSISVGLGWRARTGQPELTLALVSRTPWSFVQGNLFNQGARRGAFASADGGVALGGGGVVTQPFEAIGRAGVTGVVYYDENGNGQRDPGELAGNAVPVAVGGERVVTGPDGVYRAWGLFPYAVVNVGIDTLNLTATDVSAAAGDTLLRPTANVYARADLALLRTHEATGRIRWNATQGPLGGITVQASRDGRAAEPFQAVSFSDGEFYFPRLPAGSYTVSVAPSSLAALGATAAPVRFEVPAAAGGAAVRVPTVLLQRGGAASAGTARNPGTAP